MHFKALFFYSKNQKPFQNEIYQNIGREKRKLKHTRATSPANYFGLLSALLFRKKLNLQLRQISLLQLKPNATNHHYPFGGYKKYKAYSDGILGFEWLHLN